MKKILLGILLLVMVSGCAGVNVSVPVNVATDVAFVMVLQNNPTYKSAVVAGLNAIKTYLSNEVTYDDLILFISKQFGGKYAYIGMILSAYFDADKPIFETYLPLLEPYKEGIVKKIDRFILLAGM